MIQKTSKKGVMGPVISIFVVVLVVSILAGLSFLFIAGLKNTAIQTSPYETVTFINESGWLNSSGYTLSNVGNLGFTSPAITTVINATNGAVLEAGNYSISSSGVVTNASAVVYGTVKITGTYARISNPTAYTSINATETSGSTVVTYLPLIFLALIFGIILTIVLKIIMPYISLGTRLGGDF